MKINYTDDKTGFEGVAAGSDNRSNVSSRSDDRAYYNSRDEGLCFSAVFSHPAANDGEYAGYLKNTSVSKTLVLTAVGMNSDTVNSRFKLWFVTGTATNGVAVVPTNLNRRAGHSADATCLEDGAGTTIGGLTPDGLIDLVRVQAGGHEEMRLGDRVRLGQGDAIAVEFDENSAGTADADGIFFFYYE